ncbi:MAG: EamA family transporter RarD [Polyangiales bacterium]
MAEPSATLTSREARRGLAAALGAFASWGVLPLLLRALHTVEPLEIMAHRVVWSCFFVLLWLSLRGELGQLLPPLKAPAVRKRLMLSALLVSLNWLAFVWAVHTGRVVEASLGYFINPLVNVLLGVLVLSERLAPRQWAAVGCAALGVAWLTVQAGGLPWLALFLALTFATYGLIRKTASVEAVVGLATETLLLLPIALGYLAYHALHGTSSFGTSTAITALLGFAGIATAVPLALFAYGARRIPYSTLGVVQYLGPSLQLCIGVYLFGEPFSRARMVGFAFIWLALALYVGDALLRARVSARA